MVFLLTQYVLKAAIRDKIPLIFLISIAVSMSLSAFLGSSAITEQDQFVIVFSATALRLLSISFIVLYISFYFHRAFESRDVETMLTRPFSRFQFMMGHYLGFQIMVTIFCVLSFIVFLLFKSVLAEHYYIWFVGFFVELSLMALITIFFAMLCTRNITAILLSLGFYILGRLSGSLLTIIDTSGGSNLVIRLGEVVMQLISIIVPRFDLIAQTSWLLYDANLIGDNFTVMIIQFVVFTGFILSATYFDLIRKQF